MDVGRGGCPYLEHDVPLPLLAMHAKKVVLDPRSFSKHGRWIDYNKWWVNG